uniref:Innexin n=1 Tax=Steinernema glaseri TaxID=37863 RepID=A0A1I7Y9L7_9BILA
MFVFRILHTVPYSNKPIVKDVVASLHSYFTFNMLLGLAILVSYKQFAGRPIECMLPMGFSGAWEQYAENYCYAQDTYFVPFGEAVANVGKDRRQNRQISYYQWISFFLLFEAFCFKLPTFIWKYFATQSGMRVGEILRLASNDANTDPDVKKSNIDALRVHLEGALRFHSRLKEKNLIPHKVIRCLNIKYSRFYVSFIYMISKVAFFVNIVVQLELLNRYLLPDELKNAFGINVVHKFITSNETWKENGLFPRVREMGQRQTHTVQCVLLINLFIEKIFIFLWAWYMSLAAFTVANIFSWLFVLFNFTSTHHFLMNHLEMAENLFDKQATENQKHAEKFINCYLGGDGVFLLRMIAQHADVVFTTELVHELWKSFCSIEAERKRRKQIREEMSRPFRFDIPRDVQKAADDFRDSIASSRRPSRAQLAGFVSPPKKLSIASLERKSYDDMLIEMMDRRASDSEDDESPRTQSRQSKQSKRSRVSFRNKFGV